MGHVFISYSRSDRTYVEKLAEYLRAAGSSVWYDYRLIAGEAFDGAIQSKIANAAALLVVLSPAASESRWVARELAYAEILGKEILPLLIEESPPLLRLAGVHYEDAIGGAMPTSEFVARLGLLCQASDVPNGRSDAVCDVPRAKALGDVRNPWLSTDVRRRIVQAESQLNQMAAGQHRAVSRIIDVIKRAAVGLSIGQLDDEYQSRPRGSMLLAGSADVGKMEVARRLADIIFDYGRASARFSMAEFSELSSRARLVGASISDDGFDAGGELEVALKQAYVIVFEEIEKAHPQVLDTILPILEEGQLTVSGGRVLNFSECIIILTTDLGVSVTDRLTGQRRLLLQPGIPYEELEKIVRSQLVEHFSTTIGRPEFLAAIGDDIIVFDFINESSAHVALIRHLASLEQRLLEASEIKLSFTPSVIAALDELMVAELSEGERAIGNKVERYLVTPLARYLFDHECEPGSELTINSLVIRENGDPDLDISLEPDA